MRSFFLSIRSIIEPFKNDLVPLLRPDILEHVQVGVKQMRPNPHPEYLKEIIARAVINDIITHCLYYRVIHMKVKSHPMERLFSMIDNERHPPRQLYGYSASQIEEIQSLVSKQFNIFNLSDNLHADIQEALFERYFSEAFYRIVEFTENHRWNIYNITFQHSAACIADTGRDFRIETFHREHGREYR